MVQSRLACFCHKSKLTDARLLAEVHVALCSAVVGRVRHDLVPVHSLHECEEVLAKIAAALFLKTAAPPFSCCHTRLVLSLQRVRPQGFREVRTQLKVSLVHQRIA